MAVLGAAPVGASAIAPLVPAESEAQERSAAAPLPVIALSADRVAAVQGVFVAFFLLAHIATQSLAHFTGHPFFFGIVPMFDLDAEGNVPSGFQGITLVLSSVLLFYIASHERGRGLPHARRWLLLGFAFAYLALDELGKVHESFDFLATGGHDADVPYWILPLGIFALGIAIYMVPLLLDVPRATAVMLVISGAIYVGGAAGVELLSQKPFSLVTFGSYPYEFEVALEEGMEMLGILLFIHTLLRYIAARNYRALLSVAP
jgi:hypothetical protein